MKWPWQWGEDTDYYRNAYQQEHAAHQETQTKLHELQTQHDLSGLGMDSLKQERDDIWKQLGEYKEACTQLRAELDSIKDKAELTKEDVYSELAVELDLLPRVRKMPPGLEYQSHSGHLPPQGILNKHGIAMLFLEARALLRQERELLDRMMGELGAKQDQLVQMAISRRLQIESKS